MKRSSILIIISAFAIFVAAGPAKAQDIKRLEPEMSDYIALLNAAGYEVFNFDISSLKDDTYSISFVIHEYNNGELVSDKSPLVSLPNRRMIAEFPDEYQKEIISEGTAYDLQNGLFSLSEKVSIGFYNKVDSLQHMMISLVGIASFNDIGLPLKPMVINDEDNRRGYLYSIRPFKTDSIAIGDITPLVCVASFYYDKDNTLRFCTEKEFTLTSKTLRKIPHYYVIGIKVYKP